MNDDDLDDNVGCLEWMLLAVFICLLMTLMFMGWIRFMNG